ncbi:MAG: hypothetical protein U0R44_00445 [Candidatus Micrarchaeia archaeon]
MLNYARAAYLLLRMKHSQWRSPSQIRSYQSRKLAELVSHARFNIPFYRRLPQIRTIDDIGKLPITTKEMLRSQNDRFIDARLDKESLIRLPTSGSSGIPINSYFSLPEGIYGTVLRYHMLTECGVRPEHLTAIIMHSREPYTLLQRFGLFRYRYLSVHDDEETNLGILRSLRPDFLLSFPSGFPILSGLNDAGDRMRLKGIISTSELLQPKSRALAEKSFSCKVRNTYSVNEMRNVAWECEKGSMHVNSDSVIAEILGNDGEPAGEGEVGEVVLTPLWRRSMTLIRYAIGDRAAIGPPCECGRGSTVLTSLEGRSNDRIHLPSGRSIPGSCLAGALMHLPVLQYQVEQVEPARFIIRLVHGGTFSKAMEADAKAILSKELGEKVRIELEFPERLEKTAGGKICCVISRIK